MGRAVEGSRTQMASSLTLNSRICLAIAKERHGVDHASVGSMVGRAIGSLSEVRVSIRPFFNRAVPVLRV